MIIRGLLALSTLLLLVSSCKEKEEVSLAVGDGNFNYNWQFIRDPAGVISPELFTGQDSSGSRWQKISLPHTASIEPADSSGLQWQGIAWYRKFFIIPEKYRDKSLTIRFDGAMQVARVFLNGDLIMTHKGGYLPFYVNLAGKIAFGKQNCLLVELDNRDNPLVPPGKPLAQMDFNYYSGIYRNVTLLIKEKIHISDAVEAGREAGGGMLISFGSVNAAMAEVNIQADIENEGSAPRNAGLQYSLVSPDGSETLTGIADSRQIPASGFTRFNQKLTVKNPRLWSVRSPSLYKLRVRVLSDGMAADSVEMAIGIRTFAVSARDGFTLNGEKVRLTGTNRHQAYPYIGNALSDNAQYRDAVKIREAGFNFVRCSHYPQSPAFLDACDMLGILVMDPIPGWQFFGNGEFQDNAITDVRQMVRRDRNHPCVVLWEPSLNETEMPRQFMERAHKAVHGELPFSNVYTCGWIDDVYDIFIPARQHADPPYYWNRYSKNKPLLIAEYGDWEYYAMNAGFNQTAYAGLKPEERSSRQLRGFGQKRLLQQALNFEDSHNDDLRGHAIGDANWLMFDYKRGYAPDIESSGIMDIFRIPKFSFYFYKSQAENADPMIFIANYWSDPAFRTVKVFSNCAEVELSVNGRVVSRQKPLPDMFSTKLTWPPFTFMMSRFEPGVLEAKGFINGKEVVSAVRKTPGRPERIALSVDLSGRELQSGKNDIVFVYASVTDSVGTVLPEDHRPIRFSVAGDVSLVGANPVKAEAGIACILLKAGMKPGVVKVRAEAEGLEPGEMKVTVIE